MTHSHTHLRFTQRKQRLHPVFGLAAAAAAVMTLGMAVVLPAQLAPAPSVQQAHVDPKHLILGPTEVAILPARIDVVAARTKSAQGRSPYLPASYSPRS